MAEYIRASYKPGDPSTFVMLSNTGQLVGRGSVPDPMTIVDWTPNTNSGGQNPEDSWTDHCRDIEIVNWNNLGGYVLDGWGGVHSFGPVTPAPLAPSPNTLLQTPGWDIWRAISVDPNGSGQGYGLRADGQIQGFGPTLPPALVGKNFPGDLAVDFKINWATKRGYILDAWGGIHRVNGAPEVTSKAYLPGYEFARTILIADWNEGNGYMVDVYGGVHMIQPKDGSPVTKTPSNKPDWFSQGWNVCRDAHLVSYTPLIYKLFTNAGASHTVTVSNAPSVSIQQIPSPNTTDRDPYIVWTYSDPEGDKPAYFEFAIYTQAQFSASGFQPFNPTYPALYWEKVENTKNNMATGTKGVVNPNQFAREAPDRLANGTYRAYVRATESFSGLKSSIASMTWVQNVPAPPAPGMTVVAADDLINKITLTVPSRFEQTTEIQLKDKDGMWVPMAGGKVPIDTNLEVWDYNVGQGEIVQYRARTWFGGEFELDNTAWAYGDAPARMYPGTLLSVATWGGTAVRVRIAQAQWSSPVASHEFVPIGKKMSIGIYDAEPVRGRRGSMIISCLNGNERLALTSILNSGETLLLRTQFEKTFFRLTGEIREEQMLAQKLPGEITTVRDSHLFQFECFEVGAL